VPLVVNFDASASHDPDPGDTIASYTFDFGDGQMVTQAGPTISHTYTSKGNYRALLSVKDSRGASNINVAQAFVNALDPTDRVNYALAGNGGTASASTEHASGGFPAASAINGDRAGANWGNGTGGWNDNTRDAFPDSLEVAFNTAKTIDEIRLFTLQDQYSSVQEPTLDSTCTVYGLLDFDVQYWDGNQWVTVPNGSVTGNDHVMRVFTFPAVTTTKIRIVVNNARAHFSRIVEVEAYGAIGQ
jgi:PKD repeat protein